MKLVKAICVRIVLLALGLVAGAALVEIGLRLLEPGHLVSSRREKDLFCRFDRELGWAPLENVTGIHRKNEHAGWVHQNQFGLRGPDDMTLTKSSSQRRVLVLGDSYAWGFGTDQKELFSSPQVHETNAEILNLGVSGYGTDQEYLLYLRTGARFEVDEVVVAFTPYNDFDNNLNSIQYDYLKPFFTLEGGSLLLHTNHIRNDWFRACANVVRRHSRFWNRLGDLSHALHDAWPGSKSRGAAKAGLAPLTKNDITDWDHHGVELTIAILKEFQAAAASHHAEFSVVFIPYKPNVNVQLPNNHPLVPLLCEGLTRAGIQYREPYFEFVNAARHGTHLFYEPDTHFSPAGHALFAKFLLPTREAQAALNYYARAPESSPSPVP